MKLFWTLLLIGLAGCVDAPVHKRGFFVDCSESVCFVYSQDDNGNSVRVKENLTPSEAEDLANKLNIQLPKEAAPIPGVLKPCGPNKNGLCVDN